MANLHQTNTDLTLVFLYVLNTKFARGRESPSKGGIGPETRQTMENIRTALEAAGGSMDAVLKCTVFLADIAEWGARNAEYTTFFDNMPARSAVGVSGLGLDARVEIECLAARPDDD